MRGRDEQGGGKAPTFQNGQGRAGEVLVAIVESQCEHGAVESGTTLEAVDEIAKRNSLVAGAQEDIELLLQKIRRYAQRGRPR